MAFETYSFISANKESEIKYYVMRPETAPLAVIQIVHGMKEYIARYTELCSYLCSLGFVVCGHDQIGHGESVKELSELGYFAKNDGDVALVSDVEQLRLIMKKKYRALPYILLGHSFGSFVARAYAASHPDAIDGLILSGTAGQKQPVKLAKALCSFLAFFKGWKHRSNLVTNVAFSGYNSNFKFKGCSGNEWVTSDPEELKRYNADPKCTTNFTLSGYYDMFSVIDYIQSEQWYSDMPKGLPIFILAGGLDPVSNNTKGLFPMMEKLHELDHSNIEFKIYEKERHEPFTGLCKREAFEDVSAWCFEIIVGVRQAKMQSITPVFAPEGENT